MSNLSNNNGIGFAGLLTILANKWKNQADKSSNEQEQMWLYACSADLKSLIQQSNNQITQTQEKSKPQKPDPNVKPPTFDRVTEGFDPSKIKTRVSNERFAF